MLTTQALRQLISEAPDLGLLTAFARDAPKLQGSAFCVFPQERNFFFDDSDDDDEGEPLKPPPPVNQPLMGSSATAATTSDRSTAVGSSTPAHQVRSVSNSSEPPLSTTATTVPAAASIPSSLAPTPPSVSAATAPSSSGARRRDGSTVGFAPPEQPPATHTTSTAAPPTPPLAVKSTVSSSSSSHSTTSTVTVPKTSSTTKTNPFTGRQISSPPTTFSVGSRTPSSATSASSSSTSVGGVSSSSSSSGSSSKGTAASVSSAPSTDDVAFVWGDFGGLKDHGDTHSSNRRGSRIYGPGGSRDPQPEGDTMSGFGDFSYFLPKAVSEAAAATKSLEQSFNRSMIRRSSVAHHHKVLDELEDSPDDDHDDSGKTNSFSFSDFSMSADTSFDLSPASKVVPMEADDGAFIFGDFAVAMPDDEPPPVKKPAATPAAKSAVAASPPPTQFSKTPLGALPSPAPPTGGSSTSLTPKPPQATRTGPQSLGSLASTSYTPMTYNSGGGGKSRNVSRPLITFGALIRDVVVSDVLAHAERIRGAVFASFAENCVVSSGGDHSAQLRPFHNDGTPLSLYFGHQDMILHVTITPDLNLVATSGTDGSLSIFEVSTSKRVGDSRHTVPVLCSSFSKNGKYIVSGAQDGVCRLWSSKKKQQTTPMSTYFGHKSFVSCISFQPNGEFVATGSGDTQVHIWSASTGKSNQILSKLHTHTIMNVQFSHEGARLLTCDISKVALSDVLSGATLAVLEASSLTRSVPSTAGGKFGTAAQPPSTSKMMFTSATFAPQQAFPNYFFVATSDKVVSLHEFVVKQNANVGGSSVSTTRAPASTNKKTTDGKSAPSTSAPDVTVTISPEIWSWVARHRVAWLSTGPKMAVLVGDLGGNLTAIQLVPRQGLPIAQKAPLKVKLVK